MPTTAYAATIRVLLEPGPKDAADAQEALAKLLSDHAIEETDALLDWNYVPDASGNAVAPYPVEVEIDDIDSPNLYHRDRGTVPPPPGGEPAAREKRLLDALKALHACHRAFSSNENWTALDDEARSAAETIIAEIEGDTRA